MRQGRAGEKHFYKEVFRENMDYSIGKVSRMLGLSVEGIRNYEKSGIISSKREDGSNYRKYSYLDIASLIRAKMYRAYGFSIRETGELTNHCSLEEIAAAFDDKIRELSGDINIAMEKRSFMEEHVLMIRSVEAMTGKIRISRMPAIYRIEFSKNGEIDFSEEKISHLQTWMTYAPFVFFSSRYAENDVYGGLAIMDRYADLFGIPEQYQAGEQIQYLPETLCLSLIVKEGDTGYSRTETLSAFKDYASYHNFELGNEMIGHTVIGIHKSTDYQRYRQVFAAILNE